MDKELKEKILKVMQQRNYSLIATTNENIMHFSTPIEERPVIHCDVYVSKFNSVDFEFKYITKNTFMLTSDKIGCLFNNEIFEKFESMFYSKAVVLHQHEYGRV